MESDKWMDAEEFFRELNAAEEEVLDKLTHVPTPLVPNVPRELEDDPHQSSIFPGREFDSSGLGTYLKSQSDYDGYSSTAR